MIHVRAQGLTILLIIGILGFIGGQRSHAVPLSDIVFADAALQTCVQNTASDLGVTDSNGITELNWVVS